MISPRALAEPGPVEHAVVGARHRHPQALAAFPPATPLRRHGRSEEIAAAIALLAADEASVVTGANLLVDGGAAAGAGHPCRRGLPGLGRVATDWQLPVRADRLSGGAAGLLGLAFGGRSAAIKAAATALAPRVAAVGVGFIGRRNLLRTALARRAVAN